MIRFTKGPIARGTVRTSFVLGLRLVVQAGTLFLVARLLGPREYGAFAGVAALAVILGTLATFGTHVVLTREVSRDPLRREHVLSYAVPLTLICGGALLVMYLLICTFALHEARVDLVVLIAIGATELLLQPLFGFPSAEFLALGHIARSQVLTTLPLVLRLAAAGAVVVLHPADPLRVYGYGYFLASFAALLVATVVVHASWPRFRKWRLPSVQDLRDAAGYAVLSASTSTPAELDKTLAVRLLPLATSGVFSVGARVVGAAILPVVALLLSALPRLFREAQGPSSSATRLLRWIFGAVLVYSVALGVLLWFLAPLFVWVFGTNYRGLGLMLRWLTLAAPGMALRMAAGTVLVAFERPWLRATVEAIGVLVLVVMAVLLARRFPVTGMPIAVVSAEWTMSAIGWVLVYRSAKRTGGA